MAQITIKDAKGLFSDPNPFNTPDGAMVEADNAVIDRPGVVQARRGFEDAGMEALTPEADGRITAMTTYQDKFILAHSDNLSCFNPDDETRTEYSGTTLSPISAERVRFVQANKNLYFTTEDGIKKLDAFDGEPISAGMPRAISFTVAQSGESGFQAANSQIGYRVLYGRRDANLNFIYGAPSQRMVLSGFANPVGTISGIARSGTTVTITYSANHGVTTGTSMYLSSDDANFPSGDYSVTAATATTLTYTQSGAAVSGSGTFVTYYSARDVDLLVYLPDEVVATDFLQIYRTEQSVSVDVDPGEEMGLVYERVLTGSDIATGSFSFTDTTPDELIATLLYTSPSQEGAIAENGAPPAATCAAPFSGSLFFGNTTQRPSLVLRLLSTDGANLQPAYLVFARAPYQTYASDESDITLLVADGVESAGRFKVFSSGTPSQNVADTAVSIVKTINTHPDNHANVTAYYASGPDDPPGIIVVEAGDNSGEPIYADLPHFVSGYSAMPQLWSPALPHAWSGQGTLLSASRTGSTVTISAHPTAVSPIFAVGDVVYVRFWTGLAADSVKFPDGFKTVTAVNVSGGKNIQYTEAGAAGSSDSSTGFIVWSDIASGTSPENHKQHRVMFSKADQPEHVPLTNFFDLGSADRKVLQLARLKESLFIFKQDGLWRLRGSSPDTFSVEQFDSTVELLAPDSVAAVANHLFCLTDKGVAMISESGTRIVSGPISKTLLSLTTTPFLDTVYQRTFGVAYESDKKYILWMPTFASDTRATQAFVFDVTTGVWTRWTKEAWHGLVNPIDDQLVISRGTLLSRERKSRTYLDQSDEAIPVTIVSSSGTTVVLNTVTGIATGDCLFQFNDVNTRIVSINEEESSVTVADSDVAWEGSDASILPSISFRVKWAPIFGETPFGQKHFRDVSFMLHDARVSALTGKFSTDQVTTEQVVAMPSDTTYSTGPLRDLVRLEAARGNYLNVALEHSVALEVPSIAGFAVTLDGVSDRSRK